MAITFEGIRPGREMTNNGKARIYTLTYAFHSTSGSDTEYDVEMNPNCPRWGMAHPQNAFAWCNDIKIRQSSGRGEWLVTATFSTEIELKENPLLEPARAEWDSDTYDEPLEYDRDGKAILNSAGDPLTDVFRERTRRIVTVTKNVAQVPSWIINSEDAVNSSAFTLDGFAISTGLARLGAPHISIPQTRNGITFRELKMVFILRKDGWAGPYLDRGFRYLDGTTIKRITDGNKCDITEPACLDGSGGVLATPVTSSTAVYRTYNIYPAYDFNLLPLT